MSVLTNTTVLSNFASIGSIDIVRQLLVLAIEGGIWSLDEANEALGKMLGSGFYSPVSNLSSLVG